MEKTTAPCHTKESEFYDALVKVGPTSSAGGEGHFPHFNYNELEAPATKLLAPRLVPVGETGRALKR